MTRHLALLAAFVAVIPLSPRAAGKELTGTYLPTTNTCPSPEEARAKMTVPEGYEVRCFAHEPMVQNPVAMTWDHRGRLWVVEAYEYPSGSPHPAPFGGEAKDDQYRPVPPPCLPSEISNLKSQIPRDRVIILEDTDNDGIADKRTVFVQGLNLASAILCGDSGIYIGQQPHLIHFRDDDGDDKPDAWRVVLTGFGREDTHELLNSFCWGPDGWLYMTHGVFTKSKVRRPGQPESEGFKFDAGIGRARPMVGQASSLPDQATKMVAPPWEFEVFADGTSNPWGCDYDAAGNFFVSACVIDHFFHMAPGGIYVRQGGAPENPYAYEQLPSIVKHKHFRAAYAGVQIYQGGVYPRDTWGHAFIGNIHDNAIHEEIITPSGSTFQCEPRRDFLRANDGWFRPVSTQTAPDGNLWIMDWCDKYPCYQNAKANPEGVDRERGRIWRIVTSGEHGRPRPSADAPSRQPSTTKGEAQNSEVGAAQSNQGVSRDRADLDLKKLPTPDLVKLLEHPNNWMRRMARRMLVESKSPIDSRPPLEALAMQSGKSPATRLEALWTLHLTEDSDGKELAANVLDELSGESDPGIKAWVARISGERFRLAEQHLASIADRDFEHLSDAEGRGLEVLWPHMERLEKLSSDASPAVRLACAVSWRMIASGALTAERPLAIDDKIFRHKVRVNLNIGPLLEASAKDFDPVLQFMIWQAMEPGIATEPELWAEQAAMCQPLSHALLYKAMRRLCDTRKPENLDLALDFLGKVKDHDVLLAHALDGLEKGQEGGIIKPVKEFAPLLATLRQHANADVRGHAANLSVLWGDAAALDALIATVTNDKAALAERLQALQTVRKVRTDAVRAALLKVVQASSLQQERGQAGSLHHLPPQLALEVIRAAADLGGKEIGDALLRVAQPSRLRNENEQAGSLLHLATLDALSSRADWTKAMLDAIAEKKIPSAGFPVSVRRKLATHDEKTIRDQAFKVLGAWKESSDDTKALIAAKRKACVESEPDLANGKILFTATCGVCHPFHGGGQQVGPDLIGSGRGNLDALLTNVIDPNQIIGNGYEAVTVNTKDNRVISGRMVEDTPSHVKLLSIGGAQSVVPRDQIAKLENTKQSLMPQGFGALPDKEFRDLIWYILAPPEEGPLTREKRAALSQSMDFAAKPSDKPKRTNWRAIDWESVSLWNPDWKVSAPEFERTPVKLAECHGKSNVLLTHPFPDKKTPASLERKLKVADGISRLKLGVAADDRGDWLLKAVINGQVMKEMIVDHEKPRWKDVEISLEKFRGQEITIRLEAHANGWSWEFAYWGAISLE